MFGMLRTVDPGNGKAGKFPVAAVAQQIEAKQEL
jgi:hypothetical protein